MSDYQPPELLLLLLLQWHLGSTPGFLPTDHGFDSYFGIPFSVDMGFAYRLPCDDRVQTMSQHHVAGIKTLLLVHPIFLWNS